MATTWLLGPLLFAITYTTTQDQRGQQASFYFFTIPAQLVPYAMLAMNLLFPQGIYNLLLQLTGLVAAHLHDFLSRLWPRFGDGHGVNVLATPPFMKIFDRRPAWTATTTAYGAEQPGPLPDAWKTRGVGHRLQ